MKLVGTGAHGNVKKPSLNNALALLFLTTGLAGPDAQGGEIRGSVNLGTGYLEHPLGVAEEIDAGYLFQSLRLSVGTGGEQSLLKFSYEGQASQFGNGTQLGSLRNGLGAEWFRTSKDRRTGFSAGGQFALRSHDEWYEIYDYKETYSYLAFRKYVGRYTLWKGFAGLRIRKYDDLPEESFIEPHGQLEYKRFSENRTSIGLRIRYGWKQYNDDVASQVWGTLNLPSTSQLAARLSFSKGLSQRLGFRAWGEYRFKLSEFPYYVEEDIFDSPILDRYATEGYDLFAALKLLAPWQIWLEGGASLGDHDYGEIMFATDDGQGQNRADQQLELYGSLERTLGKGLGRPKFQLMGGWRDRDSTHPWYTYSGVFWSTSLTWNF
jgi:hypothetical protein